MSTSSHPRCMGIAAVRHHQCCHNLQLPSFGFTCCSVWWDTLHAVFHNQILTSTRWKLYRATTSLIAFHDIAVVAALADGGRCTTRPLPAALVLLLGWDADTDADPPDSGAAFCSCSCCGPVAVPPPLLLLSASCTLVAACFNVAGTGGGDGCCGFTAIAWAASSFNAHSARFARSFEISASKNDNWLVYLWHACTAGRGSRIKWKN